MEFPPVRDMMILMAKMQMCSKVLIVSAAIALLTGAIGLVFTATVVRFAAHDDMYLLMTRYDAKGDPAYQQIRTYENLFRWTEHLVQHRNDFAFRFHYTLSFACLSIATILIAWLIDREHLYRRMRDPKRQGAG